MIESIGLFVASNIASYAINKGLDNIFKDKRLFVKQLSIAINKTIIEYSEKYPKINNCNKFIFYESQIIVDELLKYRFFSKDGYKFKESDIINKLQRNHNILSPSKPEVSNFLQIFDKNIKADRFLLDLEIESFYKSEIFNLSSKVEELISILTKQQNKFSAIEVSSNNNRRRNKYRTSIKVQSTNISGLRSIVFKKQLDKLKSSSEYKKAINLIIENFSNYPSWELLIELLKFCELESEPNFGIMQFKKFRQLLGNNPTDEQIEQKEALDYYLGRLFTQIGNYQEAFYWHRNNTTNKIRRYYQLLSKFELASLHYRTENFLIALEEYEIISKLLNSVEHSIFLKIHVYLYLATLYVIKTIHNIPNAFTHKLVEPNPTKSIKYSNKALKLISTLKFEDDKNDKLAWTYLTLAFGEESKGNFTEADKLYCKSENLIIIGKITNSSIAHILIYSSRFYRRQGEYQKSITKIKLLRRFLPANKRIKVDSSIYEEVSYILYDYGKKGLAKLFFKHACYLFKQESSIELKMNWPLVERISRSCIEFGINFDI